MLLHHYFEQSAARTPSATATCTPGSAMTYAELDAAATRVAANLAGRYGTGPGDLVAVVEPASPRWLVAILGVLKAGAAYLPLDPAYPLERNRSVVHDSAATLVIGGTGLAAVGLDALLEATAPALAGPGPRPEDLAYVIYTSGSTGRPKGVAVEHRHIVASLASRFEHYPEPPATLLMPFPPAFDGAISVTYWTLGSGGCVYFPPAAAESTIEDLLWASGAGRPVTDICCVPSLYQRILAEATPELTAGLRRVIVAGEASRPALVEQHFSTVPHVSLHNEYGPTEASVWSTVHDLTAPGAVVPIGSPIRSAHVEILDDNLDPVPSGTAGELYIGGAGVARGYLGRPGLTAERFLPEAGGGRRYRTGDLVRPDEGFVLEFVGRNDDQVKWNGYRIEPGEVEACLASIAGVTAVAVVHTEAPATLVAYAVTDGVTSEDLAAGLTKRVPPYMLPARFVVLPEMPYTSNGKIDRLELARRPVAEPDGSAEPLDGTEFAIGQLVAEVLSLPTVPSDADFFQLGADSMAIIRIASASAARGVPVTARDIFRQPTVRGLAALLRKA
jgi:amino acid adenylation domain-containing protein